MKRKITQEEFTALIKDPGKLVEYYPTPDSFSPEIDITATLEKNNYLLDLSFLNLQKIYLYGARLSHINLSGADLSEANLDRAMLYQTNLSGANLTKAGLFCVDLIETNLKGTNLQDASLAAAKIRNADLSGANLAGASLFGTWLTDVNLKGANLRNVKHTPDSHLTVKNLQEAQFAGNEEMLNKFTAKERQAILRANDDVARIKTVMTLAGRQNNPWRKLPHDILNHIILSTVSTGEQYWREMVSKKNESSIENTK